MRFLLTFSLLAIPILELYTSFQVGMSIGFWYSLLWIIMAMFFGVFLIKAQKGELMWRIVEAVREQRNIKYALLDSGLSIVAGILFFIPGVLSDALALILLIMPSEWLPFKFNDQKDANPKKEETINQTEYSAHFESDVNLNKAHDPKVKLIEGEFKRED